MIQTGQTCVFVYTLGESYVEAVLIGILFEGSLCLQTATRKENGLFHEHTHNQTIVTFYSECVESLEESLVVLRMCL